MNKKIVFFDIDGTLVSEQTHMLPASTVQAINELRKNGHLAFINTGRPICEITTLHRSLNFDGYICGCGTYIEFNNKTLLSKSLDKILCKEIVQAMKEYNLEGILEGKNGVYYDNISEITVKEVLEIMDIHKYEGFYKNTTWYDSDIEFDKLVVFTKENSNFEEFHNKYKDTFDFICRGDNFFELVPSGFSKATGIEMIIDYLNIPIENTYSIGDSTNDLPMLLYTNYSIAMGNSTPSIFNSVSYITTNLEDDGIYNALKYYNLI